MPRWRNNAQLVWYHEIPMFVHVYTYHMFDEVLRYLNYELCCWSCVQVSHAMSFYSYRVLGVLVSKHLVLFLEPCYVFMILSVKLWFIELSQSCDSGNLRNLSNFSSSKMWVTSVFLVNLSNFSILSQSSEISAFRQSTKLSKFSLALLDNTTSINSVLIITLDQLISFVSFR